MTNSTDHPAFQLPADHPYHGVTQLYEQPAVGQDFVCVRQNDFTKATDEPTRKKEFAKLPPHLQQEVMAVSQIQQQITAARQHAATQAKPPHASSQDAAQHPKVEAPAQEAGVKPSKKSIALQTSTTYQVEARGMQVKLETAFTPRDKYGVSMPIQMEQKTWEEVGSIYTKYLDHEDHSFPKEGATIKEAFFYQEENGDTFFEVKFKYDRVLYRSTVEVDPNDIDNILALHAQYPHLIKNPPQKVRVHRCVRIGSEELPKKLMHRIHPHLVGESFHHRGLLLRTVEKSQQMAKNHSIDFAHPMNSYELTNSQIDELVTRPISRYESFVSAEAESDYVDSYIASQNIFSKSPHQARVYYNIEPRTGNAPSIFEDEEAQHFARLYPLHFSVNARLGELHGDDAHLVEKHESAVIHSKSNAYGDEYTTLVQTRIELPDLEEESLQRAIIDQAARYHEIKQGFTSKTQKYISLRDPILGIGLTDDEEGDFDEKVRLSIFIRVVALYLVNSKPGLKGPKLKLEFEYKLGEEEDELPEIADFVQDMRTRINYAIDSEQDLRMGDLVDKYITDDLPLPPKAITPPPSPDVTTPPIPPSPPSDLESLADSEAFGGRYGNDYLGDKDL